MFLAGLAFELPALVLAFLQCPHGLPHAAEFVGALGRQFLGILAPVERRDCPVDRAERHENPAQDPKRKDCSDDDGNDACGYGAGHRGIRLLAGEAVCAVGLGGEIGDKLLQCRADRVGIRARLRQKGVAEHSVAVGVGVRRLERLFDVGLGAGADVLDGRRGEGSQLFEIGLQPLLRLGGAPFRKRQQRYRQVGQPVAHLGEVLLGLGGGAQAVELCVGVLDARLVARKVVDHEGGADRDGA